MQGIILSRGLLESANLTRFQQCIDENTQRVRLIDMAGALTICPPLPPHRQPCASDSSSRSPIGDCCALYIHTISTLQPPSPWQPGASDALFSICLWTIGFAYTDPGYMVQHNRTEDYGVFVSAAYDTVYAAYAVCRVPLHLSVTTCWGAAAFS